MQRWTLVSTVVLLCAGSALGTAVARGPIKKLRAIDKAGSNETDTTETPDPNPSYVNIGSRAGLVDMTQFNDVPRISARLVEAPRGPPTYSPSVTSSSSSSSTPSTRNKEQSRLRRLRIDRKTGFDGKVRHIRINSDEDIEKNMESAGVRAYGLPKKQLQNNGNIERMPSSDSRSERLVQAYGMPRKQLEDNGRIERVPSPPVNIPKDVSRNEEEPRRSRRSINETQTANELDDLEAQDAKVFRPLFVYRQQQARRQQRNRKKYFLNEERHRQLAHYHEPCPHRQPYY